MAKILMKGNEAFGKAAMVAGCKYFFGYQQLAEHSFRLNQKLLL